MGVRVPGYDATASEPFCQIDLNRRFNVYPAGRTDDHDHARKAPFAMNRRFALYHSANTIVCAHQRHASRTRP